MSDIKPLPSSPDPEPIHLHRGKLTLLILLILGALALGRLTTLKPVPEPRLDVDVLGEQTRTLESYIPDDAVRVATSASQLRNVSQDMVLSAGRELIATASSQLSTATDKIASDAARSVTDFIYKQTIERLIQNLIQTLPDERRTKYSPTISPSP